jgi:hypothetical protein
MAFDVYNGASAEGSLPPFFVGRVNRVILGSQKTNTIADPDYTCEKDLGAIYYEPLFINKSGANANSNNSRKAYPMFGNIRHYPNIGEQVLIFSGPSSDMNDGSKEQDYYYLPPFSTWGDPHHNVFPRLDVFTAQVKNTRISSDYDSQEKIDNVPVAQGFTFEEQINVKQLRPFEGDIIIQGRFGQSIRFGSSVPNMNKYNTWSDNTDNGKPITIITNKQRSPSSAEMDSPTFFEDINKDGSSIYLTEDHSIIMTDINLFPKRSYATSKANNPQVADAKRPERYFKTNEFLSAADQDRNAVNTNVITNNSQNNTEEIQNDRI